MGQCQLDCSGSLLGWVESSCEIGNGPSCSIKRWGTINGYVTGVLLSSSQLYRISK
jgi:hypothetical protein